MSTVRSEAENNELYELARLAGSKEQVLIPRVPYRTDGKCALCAGANPRENRNGCNQCWNEYHKSRDQKEKLRLLLVEEQTQVRAEWVHQKDVFRRTNPPNAEIPVALAKGYMVDLTDYAWRLDKLDRHWKRWSAFRKNGEIKQGVLFREWYDKETNFRTLDERYK